MDIIRTLGDRYDIESPLGHGGMATVFRGSDRVLGRPVAIKVLAERYAGDEKFVTRFKREARAAAGLNHTNIVSVFDTGDTDGRHYIVMEMVEGETLADLLKREGPLSPDRAARISGTIARALEAAHEKGLIHRDVKPGNVMLTRDGDVKVMDFGIARAATDDTLTQTGMVLGTASYLSPEQSRGEPVDHRSDIYSLGCVMYEMLTGRPPFAGDTQVGVAYKHVHERPEPPSAVNPAVPAEVEAVVMRALEKDPAARHPSAEAFRDALTSAVTGEPTEPLVGSTAVLPRSDAEPTQALSHRRPPRRWLAAAVVGLLVIIAGILTVALTGENTPERRQRTGHPRRAEQTPANEPVTTTPPISTDVDRAASALQEVVQVSLAQGLIDADSATKILEEADKALGENDKGSLDKALEHLTHASEEVDKALVEGVITSDTAQGLHDAIDALRAAMSDSSALAVETPLDEHDDESSGPGNSGNAPGHNKKEKDD